MESIEQIRLENDKLKERLNNAAKFFREQKAQIEALTKENEELKSKALNSESQADWEAKYIELKETIERTPKEEVISTEKWNKLVTEKEELQAQLNTSNAACADMEKTIHKNLEDIEKLNKENDKLKSDYTVLNDEYLNNENILAETLAANKELVESKNDLNLKINELEKEYTKIGKEYDELRKTYAQATMIYNNATVESKNKIDTLSKRIEELNNLNANQSDRISKLDEVCSTKEAEISKLKNVCDELEILRNKNIKENEVLNKNIEVQKTELDKLNNEINTYKNYALKIEQIKNILDIPKQVNTTSKPKEQKRMGSHLESKSEIFSL